MRLSRVTVTNFRSILAAESFDVADYTVLVGPNNEGKSNLLRAMVLGLDTIHSWAQLDEPPGASGVEHRALLLADRARRMALSLHERRARSEQSYRWDRDFPLTLQDNPKASQSSSRIRLDFELDEAEVDSFKREIGSANNGRLPIELLLGPRSARLSVVKQGPGAKAIASQSVAVARLVASNLQMFSIPTARTESNVLRVIQSLVARELRKVTRTDEYREAAATLDRLREAAVAELQGSMRSALQEYLSDVQDVAIEVDSVTDQSTRVDDLWVDDGVLTPIAEKGDGVKSLTAISLMQQAARDSSSSVALIAAIDEPEAHLHPEAIHKLKFKLLEIARTQQVIVSTHAPVLVNRGVVSANVVVSGNRARSAKTLSEVRQVLGVRLADNLSHAELVLLVEGVADEVAMRAILAHRSRAIKKALTDDLVGLIPLRGLRRLHTELLSQRNNVCRAFLIADDDRAARDHIASELKSGLLTQSDYTLLRRKGGDSELEDFYTHEVVQEAIQRKFAFSIPDSVLKSRKKKWSDRIREALDSAGKIHTPEDLEDLKMELAKRVADDPGGSISEQFDTEIASMVSQVEEKVEASV